MPDTRASIPAWWPHTWHAALPQDELTRQRTLRALHRLSDEVNNPVQHLSQAVDASRHPLKQWCRALADCQHYADEHNLDIAITTMLGYLQGASLCKEAELGWQLPDLFAVCVEEYGFVG